MNEQAVVFGRYENLVGVCGLPEQQTDARQQVAVLMLTAGMLHHVGPSRLHVQLARRLSSHGYYSLRFCLSGIGESLAVGAKGSSLDRAAEEVRQAMDWLEEEHGITRCVLLGLCSGADDGLHAAQFDSRVIGLVQLDGCGYRTPQFYLRKLLWKDPRKILQRLQGIPAGAKLRTSRRAGEVATLPFADDIREFPSRDVAQQQLQALVDRGLQMLFIYTGGVNSYFNSARQFEKMFPGLESRGRIECDYYAAFDHVTRLQEDRQVVIDRIVKFIDERFGSLGAFEGSGQGSACLLQPVQ